MEIELRKPISYIEAIGYLKRLSRRAKVVLKCLETLDRVFPKWDISSQRYFTQIKLTGTDMLAITSYLVPLRARIVFHDMLVAGFMNEYALRNVFECCLYDEELYNSYIVPAQHGDLVPLIEAVNLASEDRNHRNIPTQTYNHIVTLVNNRDEIKSQCLKIKLVKC